MWTVIVATAFGGPEVLEVRQADLPAPGRGEVSVQVRAAGVNPVDIKSYAGQDKGHDETKLPLRLGVEVSGVVIAVGDDAIGPAGPITVGDEVIAYRILGGYADSITVPAAAIVPKPTDLPWETAAAMMLTGTTAIHLLTATGVTDGDTVLIHGAAGGVGSLAAQIAIRDNATVIGTASEGNFDRLRGYGVIPIAYGDGLLTRALHATPDGINAAIDTVGTDETIDVSLAVVRDPTRVATIVAFDRAQQTGIKALGGNPDTAGAGRWKYRRRAPAAYRPRRRRLGRDRDRPQLRTHRRRGRPPPAQRRHTPRPSRTDPLTAAGEAPRARRRPAVPQRCVPGRESRSWVPQRR